MGIENETIAKRTMGNLFRSPYNLTREKYSCFNEIFGNQRIEGGDKNDIILDFTMHISDSYGDYRGGDKRNRGNRSCIIW